MRVEERPLTIAERQMKLDLIKEKEEDEEAMPADAPSAADLAAANSEAGT